MNEEEFKVKFENNLKNEFEYLSKKKKKIVSQLTLKSNKLLKLTIQKLKLMEQGFTSQ